MGDGIVMLNRGQPGGAYSVVDFPSLQGEVFYVGSTAVYQGVVGVDATGYGRSPTAPFATLDYAVGQCTANQGDVIYLLPGHNENIGNAQIDIDVAGVKVIGLGEGTLAPRFDFDHANASIDIGANNVTVENIRLLPSVTAVLIGIDIEAGKTNCTLRRIVSLSGEDGAGVDEFAKTIDLKAGADYTLIEDCDFSQHASAAGVLSNICLTGASNRVTIRRCNFWAAGAGLVAGINGDTTLSTWLLIEDCNFDMDAEPGIEVLTGTTGIITRCFIRTDLGTLNAAIVADAMARFDCRVAEPGEAGGLVGTATVDD